MTEKNNDESAGTHLQAARRQTLGLKSPLASAAPKEITPAPEKMMSRSSRGNHPSVLVVTKPRAGMAEEVGYNGNNRDVDQKLALLKQAELDRKAMIQKQKLATERAAEQQRQKDIAKQLIQEEKEREEQKSAPQVEVEVAISEPLVEAQQLHIHRSFTLQKTRVRNLDHIARPEPSPAPQVEVIEETVIIETTTTSDGETKTKVFKKELKQVTLEPEVTPPSRKPDLTGKRNAKRISVTEVMMMDGEEPAQGRRFRSLSAIKRAKDKVRRKHEEHKEREKVVRDVLIPDVISVQELASRMSEKSSEVIKSLMKLGIMATLNQSIDADTAELIITEFGHNHKRITNEEIERILLNEHKDSEENLLPRAPVVTIMGHVDHGKTSLLDALRSTDVAAGEVGGITQHIGAYQVSLSNGRQITFLDTPGHEAFTAMRLRGAKITDIVVLVVAADDGIMEQTIEAINHAKAAQVPIIVAINKMDKPSANPQRVKNELLQHHLVPEEVGGDVIVVEVSAKARINLDKLEEVILLQAEILDLKANPNRCATGAVIESKMDRGRGPIATLLVQNGTLNVGDIVVAGTSYGSIRGLINDKGQNVLSALPSTPVEVIGMSTVPTSGDAFVVTPNERIARDLCEHRLHLMNEQRHLASRRGTFEQMLLKAGKDGIKELQVIVKGDVHGSVEAIVNSIQKLSTEEVMVRVLHSAAGSISESDVTLASASSAIILGFNVRAVGKVRDLAKQNGVDVRYYSIIYDLVDDIKAAMTGMLSPVFKEHYLGTAEVKQLFDLTKFGKVAGCYVTDGIARRNCNARLIRGDAVIHDGKIKALRRFKEDLREVKSGFECGISFEKYEEMEVGDRIEFYELTEEVRKL